VIGIGPSVGLVNLDSFATAGGTGSYFPATSPEQLTAALTQVVSDLASHAKSCSFASPPPSDPTLVAVYLNKSIVAREPDNGWTFGATSTEIVLAGNSCDAVKANPGALVEILLGCPGVPPPSRLP